MKLKKFLYGIISIIVFTLCVFISFYFLLAFGFSDMKGWEKMILVQRDPFYVGSEDDQSIRIPLLKPYDVHTFSHSVEEGKWVIDLKFGHKDFDDPLKDYFISIFEVKKIAVRNGLVMIYADPYIEIDHIVPAHWVVIIPDKNIEKGFLKEDEFQKFIHIYFIEEPQWETINEAYKQFKNTGCLDWIPDCQN